MTAGSDPVGVAAALARSNLRGVSDSARARLLRDATVREVAPGVVVQPEGQARRHVHLVVSGLIRMFVSAADGRSVTVRYCRSGSLIGVASLFGPDFRLPVCIQAVTASRLLDIPPDIVTELSTSDAGVTRALLTETSERVQAFLEEVPRASFTTVTQRVARHVLDLASVDDRGELVAQITQEDLASAVGTVREVAARALRALRDAGFVRTERSRITLVDAEALLDVSADT